MSANTGAIGLNTPSRIGVVVKDIDKTVEFLSTIWGLDPWETSEFSPTKDDMMIGEPFSIKVAMANLGPVVLELVQPLAGRSIWSEFLEANGEGLYNICFNVSNWEEMVSKLQEQGGRILSSGFFFDKRWAYLDIRPGGIVVELVGK